MKNKYDVLKLENQLCFPLYVCAKEVVKMYKPFLDKIDLTYTQYIAMMVMWERERLNVKELGEYLYLDSGTLTPVLKKLESKGYIIRARSKDDERNLMVTLTDKGNRLKEKAVEIPMQLGKCVKLNLDESQQLYRLLYKMLNSMVGSDPMTEKGKT
ncbi:MarR family winged helix-turn-helix transcriptional regulator [Clostridium tyrobutyricum]|uniref:MarR family winged helix-turn-helix transcriptional regulator n=1 Tax=Clostridium tyrobutyricum TaxID=1519 RepID=UPI00057F2B45|nr:MarR family transcriptional regulator [Clostridium tyrobutyricum]